MLQGFFFSFFALSDFCAHMDRCTWLSTHVYMLLYVYTCEGRVFVRPSTMQFPNNNNYTLSQPCCSLVNLTRGWSTCFPDPRTAVKEHAAVMRRKRKHIRNRTRVGRKKRSS